jgi:hypothetical protein
MYGVKPGGRCPIFVRQDAQKSQTQLKKKINFVTKSLRASAHQLVRQVPKKNHKLVRQMPKIFKKMQKKKYFFAHLGARNPYFTP